jgi:pilus assembly protein Flp/PilA
MGSSMEKVMGSIRAFVADEDGIALTEYLVLLGLIVAAVVVAVGAAGSSLAGAWGRWGNWWDGLEPEPLPA